MQLPLWGPGVEPVIQRARLLQRLEDEGADDLTDRLAKCGLAFKITCKTCGHQHELSTRCNRKWCPCCARQIAAKRAAKLRTVAASFKWPLFITLTVPNLSGDVEGIDFIRDLRKAFGRLRHKRIWKERVKGGAAAIEVTNTGKGWHPHLHALLDCEWLAFKVPPPSRRDSPEHIAHKCQEAAKELSAEWTKATRSKVPCVVNAKRCNADAAKEIMKYAVKGSDLIESPDEIAPILRMMDATRLVTTFGSAFGIEVIEEPREPITCPNGHSDWTTAPRIGHTADDWDEEFPMPDGWYEWSARQRIAYRHSWRADKLTDAQIAAEAAEDDIPF